MKIKKLHPDAVVPTYATDGSACFDLTAIEVSGGGDYQTNICRTGLAFEVPEGFAMLIYSRSSQGFKNDIRLANCVGVIDSDYRGEVMVKLTRDKPWSLTYSPPLLANAGDRVAQAMLIPVEQVSFEVVDELGLTERGDGGFGSSGA